jgi:hypothetical protein
LQAKECKAALCAHLAGNIPGRIDTGVAVAAVLRLDAGRILSARGYARAAPGYACLIRGRETVRYRPNRIVAKGAVYINLGVRCVDDGGAARLYSQSGPPGLFVFSMIIGAVPFVVIMLMSAAGPTGGGEVFAALTALPPGLVTVTGA